ncbi:MAG: motility associated factor glycosyltransferase family protein [Lachnospiraceae bacterium]|nr:motility associated factor glycosyltransferase family protein [Lachnospiraceae bacterium]
MNDMWNKNIEALSVTHPALAEKLSDYVGKVEKGMENLPDEGFECGTSIVADRKILFAVKDGATFQLDTLYDQAHLMEMWYSNTVQTTYQLKCIFFGLGNGMYVRKLFETGETTLKALVYEPGLTVFLETMQEFDLTDILSDKRLQLIVEGFAEEPINEYLYRFISYHDIKHSIYQAYPNYSNLMRDKVKEFDERIQLLLMGVRATRDVLGRYGRKQTINSIVNTEYFVNGKSLYDFQSKCPRDIPVFIVASGPSLDKNGALLDEAKNKALVIAADSAVSALLKKGVVPDLFVTTDAVKSPKHMDNERAAKIPFVAELESNDMLLKNMSSNGFFINDLNPYVYRFLRSKNIVLPVFSTGGSVANTACAIAIAMGFKHIVLVGQDLAYTNNKTHASDTVRGQMQLSVEDDNLYEIEGYYGDKVITSSEFQLYRDWFEEQIENHPEVSFYNATEGGAMIHGAINISLKDAIKQFCLNEVDMDGIFADTKDLLDDSIKEEYRTYIGELPDKLEVQKRHIQGAIRDYDKMIELAHKGKFSGSQMTKLLESTSKVAENLEKVPEMYYVMCLMQKELQEITEDVYETEQSVTKEIISAANKGKEYLDIVLKGVNVLLGKIEDRWESVEFMLIRSRELYDEQHK